MQNHDFVATSALAVEDLVAAELQSFGAQEIKVGRAVVRARGSLEVIYRSCLWSRVASRIVLPIASFTADSADALYAGVRAVPWHDHLGPDDTLAVDFSEHGSAVTHTQFGAQKVKDAIVDCLRDKFGRRPDIDRANPKLRVNVRLDGCSARWPLIAVVQACIDVATDSTPPWHPCARPWLLPSCCAHAGLRQPLPTNPSSIPCAAPARYSLKRRSWRSTAPLG